MLLFLSCTLIACTQEPIDSAFFYEHDDVSGETLNTIVTLQESLNTENKENQTIFQLCDVYLQAVRESEDDTIFKRVEQLLKHTNNDDRTILYKGLIAAGRHHFEEAKRHALAYRKIDPEHIRNLSLLADSQVELGLYSDAIATLQTLLDLDAGSSAYSRVAYVREIFGDIDGAIEMMQLSLESPTTTTEHGAWLRTELGRLLLYTSHIDAKAAFESALELNPNYDPALYWLARIATSENEFDSALSYVAKAQQERALTDYALLEADIRTLQEKNDEAQQIYKDIEIEMMDESPSKTDSRREKFVFQVHYNSNVDTVLSKITKLYTQRPTIFIADLLSWAHFQLGNTEKAWEYSLKARATGTIDPTILYHAGMIAAQRGEEGMAQELLQNAMQSAVLLHPLDQKEAEKKL